MNWKITNWLLLNIAVGNMQGVTCFLCRDRYHLNWENDFKLQCLTVFCSFYSVVKLFYMETQVTGTVHR